MILVLGAGGQLGKQFVETAAARVVDLQGLTRAELSICDRAAVAAALDRLRPALVVNAGAYTAVDKAESERAAAWAGNVDGPHILAEETARRAIPIVHYSTDYVFDGAKTTPYTEEDPTAPLGVYGETKRRGEEALAGANPLHVILRTSWVYGPHGANFLRTMLRLGAEREELRVVADQRGAPTSTAALVDATLAIAPRLMAKDEAAWGLYHLTGAGVTTWCDFAAAILEEAAALTGHKPRVTPITTADYPTPARRPANSTLSNDKFIHRFGHSTPHWRTDTSATVRRLIQGRAS